MAVSLEFQLKLITLLCKAYFIIVLFLKVAIFLNVTLPQVCNKDTNTYNYITIFTYFILTNIIGNYICMWYMSRLSFVKPEHVKSLSSPGMYLTSSLTSSVFDDVRDDRQLARGDYSDLYAKPTSNVIEYTSHLTSPYMCGNKNMSMQTNSLSSNSEHSFGSYFTSQNNFSGYNDISQESSYGRFDSKLSLSNGVMADPTEGVTTRPKCKDCNTLVPARAKHCPICQQCILKRDHHCFFVGCCIGYHNQRFFIKFCLYTSVGEIFNSVVTFMYLKQHTLGESTGWGYLVYLLPVLLFVWFLGGVSGSTLGMMVLLYWSVLTAIICAYFFCVQVNLVYHGQTQYEHLKGMRIYQGTVRENMISVFGRCWLIGLIIPAPFLGYQGSGADWRHLISDKIV